MSVSMKSVKDDMRNAAWALAEQDAKRILPILQDDDLTIARYAERFGVSRVVAERRLTDLVNQGELVPVMCRRSSRGGGHVRAYRKP